MKSNSVNCSAWSGIATETVVHPPGAVSGMTSSPNPSYHGSYTVSWNGAARAASYQLQESTKQGGWNPVYNGAATQWSASGKANGYYSYRVRPCNSAGCAGWAGGAMEHVVRVPAGAPGLSAPVLVKMGNAYTVSWTAVSGTTNYELEASESKSFSGARPISEGTALSQAETAASATTSYSLYYRVRACNGGGCSAWSNVAGVDIMKPVIPPCTRPPCRGAGPYGVGTTGLSSQGSTSFTVLYHYDANGNLANVTNASDGTVYWQADGSASIPAVSAFGAPQAWTLGNGIHVARERDPATGAVTSIMAGPNAGSAKLVSLAYGYGPLGNAKRAMDIRTGVSRYLSHDALSRQTQALIHNTVSGYTTLKAHYDAGGNITSRTLIGSYSYTGAGAEPHAVTQAGTANYSYNKAGEMSAGGALTNIEWSQGGRATKIVGRQTTRLAYTSDGNLIQKNVGGQMSRYFGKLLVKTGETSKARIVAAGEVVAIVKVNAAGHATTDYLIHDAQGSPAAMLDQSGEIIARFAFNAWGKLVNPETGTTPDPKADTKEALTTLGYTGHEEFWAAGLIHTWARLYNPAIGRWLSPDPTVPGMFNVSLGDG